MNIKRTQALTHVGPTLVSSPFSSSSSDCCIGSENIFCGWNGRISSGILKVRREKMTEEMICEPIKLLKPLSSAVSLLLLCFGLRLHGDETTKTAGLRVIHSGVPDDGEVVCQR